MPREYDEKRDYMRISVDCWIEYITADSTEGRNGKVKNLSGRGMMFYTDEEIQLESSMEVTIKPDNELTPPLHARVKVVRVAKKRRGDGFEIGAVIQEMLDD